MSDIVATLAESAQQLIQADAPYEIIEQDIDGIAYRLYRQAPHSVKELLDAGRAHGDNIFLSYEGEEWSFKRFFQQADTIAYQLVNRYGVKKGDRIAIAMRNFPEWMTSYVAIASLGAVVVPLNSWGQKDELTYGLNDCGASVVFCDQRRYEHIADELADMALKAVVARPESAISTDNAESFEDFLDNTFGVEIPAFAVADEDPVMIMYTSGTTGKPKGAVSSHRNIIQAVYNFEFHSINSAMANPKAIEAMFAGGHAPSSLLAVPLFHVSGLYAMFLLSLRGGRKIVMMYKWDPLQAIQLIEEHSITTLSAVPSMVMDALGHPDYDQYNTSSLKALGGGGAAPPPLFAELAYSKVDNVYPGTGYGMTENNASCSNCTGEAFRYKPNSAGTLSPIVDFKTCDENGGELARGERGEIWMRSPTVVQGYWNKPEENRKTFVDGWLATGDIGYLDDENFVFIVDRAKDIIIRAGENISAAEIEGCLHDHPAIWEVAAIGVPHQTLGEELAVVVNFKEAQTISEQQLREFVSSKLAGFKVPSHVFVTDQPLPRNASGKILKKNLKQQYGSEAS